MMISQPRCLELNTPIGADISVQIAAPRSAHGQEAARAIQDALQAKGARVEWQDDPEGAARRSAAGPIVLVGNLADSRCIKELYYHSLCATDLCYPGPGGSELRTLCDPFGTGHNVILIGYSDADGAREAAQVFRKKLSSENIPHLKELHITRLPLPAADAERYRTGILPGTPAEIANTMDGDSIGYLYYLTGEAGLGETYRKVWQAILSCGYDKTEDIVQSHLFSLWRLLPWRLVEDMDLFGGEERLAITQYIYGWAESEEGWRSVANCPRTQRPNNPRQNHELIPAMALMHAADYFETHFPHAGGPDKWRTVGRTCFEPYGSSWKPLCDGLCHGWWMSQPVMLEHALLDPTHRYFEEGGARRAAECAMAIVNNDGWMPSAGDGAIIRQFPGPVLRIAADYYQDGRYRHVHDLAPHDRRFGWQPLLPRAFDSGVKPEVPHDHAGVTVVPVDPLIYHIWEREPELAVDAVTSPPASPIGQCFDKLAVRSGWNLADDYLLIDGLGGGSHSYDDAAGIIEYARLGVSVIVQEDSLVHSAPEDHSVVTIVREGESGIVPGFAALEANHRDDTGKTYLRIRLRDYAGADWIREVHLFPGQCAVFIDTVTANLAGDYAISAHFRTPNRIALEGQVAMTTRKSPCCETVEVRLTSLSDASRLSLKEVPFTLRYSNTEDQEMWCQRYRTEEMVLMALAARETAHLEPGESVRMVHLAQARGPGEAIVTLGQDDAGIFMSDGETRTELRSFSITPPPPSETESGKLRSTDHLHPVYEAAAKITALEALAEGSLAVGTASGVLSLWHEDRVKWSAKLDGPIHDIGAVQGEAPLLVAGHCLAALSAYDRDGQPQWTSRITREPSPWPWWELPTPAPIQVAGGVDQGEAFFAVGCGDLQMRGYDHKGQEQWMWRYNEGVPGRVVIAEVDGSGEPHIVVGGEILSDQATCRLLKPDGTLVAELEVEGWTSMLTALAFGNHQNRHFIGCGANRGKNLHLYERVENRWQRLWRKRLGGRVTGIVIMAESNCIFVATDQGFLLCYDLDGVAQWHLLFDQGVQHLARHGQHIVAIDYAGTLREVNSSAHTIRQSSLPGPCSRLAAGPRGLHLACDNKICLYPRVT